MATDTINQNVKATNSQSTSGSARTWLQYLPSGLFVLAAAIMLVSMTTPYWGMVLHAPQYPGGLELRVFVNRMTGDEDPVLDEVHEIDGLNHYIGMQSLYNAAKFERSIAIPAVIVMVISLIVAAVWRKRWTWLLAIPALFFPYVFLGDLAFWMNHYGQNLDPYAPLSSAIHPFTPPVLGEGVVGQFRTVASVQPGWYMIVAASLLILIAVALRIQAMRSNRTVQE